MAKNYLVPPSWPKMASNQKKDLKSTLNQFLTMKGAPDNFLSWLKKTLSNKLSDDINKIFL